MLGIRVHCNHVDALICTHPLLYIVDIYSVNRPSLVLTPLGVFVYGCHAPKGASESQAGKTTPSISPRGRRGLTHSKNTLIDLS